jgi:hypothetical protein
MVAAGMTRPLATGARCDGEGDDMDEMTTGRASELVCLPFADRELTDGQIMDAWVAWLYETHGEDLPENVLHLVYAKAYEDGHSSGLREVERYFIELVEWAEKIRAVR